MLNADTREYSLGILVPGLGPVQATAATLLLGAPVRVCPTNREDTS